MDAQEIIDLLDLKPLVGEGGFFAETYRGNESVAALPVRYRGEPRSFSTAIYYLLTPESFSSLHRVESDEVFHFYLGDPVEMLQLFPDSSGKVINLGTDLKAGQRPQVVVPREIWQGARLVDGGKFALLGATVAPGFEYSDFESGRREPLLKLYPQYETWIRSLTYK
jgi:predicted cupin superfamily sugar epimerase